MWASTPSLALVTPELSTCLLFAHLPAHPNVLPRLVARRECGPVEYDLIVAPVAKVEKVSDTPYLFRAEGEWSIAHEALALLDVLGGRPQVPRPVNVFSPVALYTEVVADDELHNVLRDVFGHVGHPNFKLSLQLNPAHVERPKQGVLLTKNCLWIAILRHTRCMRRTCKLGYAGSRVEERVND